MFERIHILYIHIGLINIKYKLDDHGNLRVELGETTDMSGKMFGIRHECSILRILD